MNRKDWKVLVWVGSMLVGCGGGASGEGGEQTAKTKTTSQALWACNTKNTRVVCTAPVTDTAPKDGAYVCKPGDYGSSCPDATSVKNTAGLEALLSDARIAQAFADKPWACLLTGKHQLQCARDVGVAVGAYSTDGTAPGATPVVGNGNPEGAGAGTGTGSGSPAAGGYGTDGTTQPPPPASCAKAAWETYFAALATYEYTQSGVAIQFPREIFDANATFNSLAIASANVKVTPGAPSCHDGEWEMREQAWLDSVTAGCSDSNTILVLCQQAANYAPSTSKCNTTGSW